MRNNNDKREWRKQKRSSKDLNKKEEILKTNREQIACKEGGKKLDKEWIK